MRSSPTGVEHIASVELSLANIELSFDGDDDDDSRRMLTTTR